MAFFCTPLTVYLLLHACCMRGNFCINPPPEMRISFYANFFILLISLFVDINLFYFKAKKCSKIYFLEFASQ
jgi:hypothetical protein